MDRVKFGRALGQGAREAAKALVRAADAATEPNPEPNPSPAARQAGTAAGTVTARTVQQARAKTAGVKRGAKRFGEAVWGPFVKLSGVLWLELTGVFFGLFALTAAVEVFKHRADFHPSTTSAPDARLHLFFAIAMVLVFGYFTISSFMRARRRGKR